MLRNKISQIEEKLQRLLLRPLARKPLYLYAEGGRERRLQSTYRIEKFEIKRRGRAQSGEDMENNGTEGGYGPIETTIYQRILLSVMAAGRKFR